jgi:disulfide bond formation protein DsbB
MISTSTMTLLFATLAVLAAIAAVVLHAVRWLPLPEARRGLAGLLDGQEVQLAFVVALVATLGSLYLSEVAHFVPCRLCWYQRIAMYPLPVLLGIAWWKRDAGIRRYVVPLALIGLLISTYHILVERFPSLEDSGVCEVSNPCTIRWVERFGFVTIPTMALAAFALISGLLVHPAPGAATPAEPSSPSAAEPSSPTTESPAPLSPSESQP